MDKKSLNVSEARKEFPTLIDLVAVGRGQVIITRRGKPVARLVPYGKNVSREEVYPLRGLALRISDDFNEPMPELWDALRS